MTDLVSNSTQNPISDVMAHPMKIAFYSQGCRLNHAETSAIENGALQSGHAIVEMASSSNPDVVIVNTCTVTENGDADTRRLVNKINRSNPQAKIALIGCQSQVLKSKLLKLKNVQWVVGNDQKMAILDIIRNTYNHHPQLQVSKMARQPFTVPYTGQDRHHKRANLKIQDGCDFYCSFCVIPFARGPARSRVLSDILKEAQALVESGHHELVLTGVNLGTYEFEGATFLDVVTQVGAISGLKRLRVSSIEPTTIPTEWIALMPQENTHCRYLHIPLQSGCDAVLHRMSRKYTTSEFDQFIRHAFDTVPDICIGTDVIVGFPGETEADFMQTVDFLSQAPLHYFHVFSYSERLLARSKKLDDQVPSAIIAKRSAVLRNLSQKKRHAFYTSQLGKTVTVLVEQSKHGWWTGLTDNFIRVKFKSPLDLENQLVSVQLNSIEPRTGSSIIAEFSPF